MAKVEFHAGELFPRVGFIVTNLELPSRAVVRFYNKRSTAELPNEARGDPTAAKAIRGLTREGRLAYSPVERWS